MRKLSRSSVIQSALLLSFSLSVMSERLDNDTGLVIDKGLELVKGHCTACHSAKLVSQNRMTRDSWLETIRWMQKSQGLWSLGEAEGGILDYLERHYSPKTSGRRKNLPPALLPRK